MKEIAVSEDIFARLEKIYDELQELYEGVANQLDFSCTGCPDNCCDSYFLHHTYLEWAYLWRGFSRLDASRQEELLERCRKYLVECERMESRGERPQVMCPLLDDGLCSLYTNRMLVCRTHGVPAKMVRPDGQALNFPGCFRCQDIVKEMDSKSTQPVVDRTPLLRELALLENELMGGKRHLMPRVKMTIAAMLVNGPPRIPLTHCEKNRDSQEGVTS